MTQFVPSADLRGYWARRPLAGRALKSRIETILPEWRCREASEDIVRWPGYRPTPLYKLPALAARLGLGSLLCKFEGDRFGVGSFKALGASYALGRAIGERIGAAPYEVVWGNYRRQAGAFEAAAATDGNHGRALAWAGRQSGCHVRIYVPRQISPGRIAAIESYGAEVVQIAGTYDDAVHRCHTDCLANGGLEITDTCDSLDPGAGGVAETLSVMSGYSVLVDEMLAAIDERPTHLFLQAGVGGFAAAVVARLVQRLGPDHGVKIVVVEAERAACVMESMKVGRATTVAGSLDTIMAGLACGEASRPAFEILRAGASFFLAISDSVAVEAMQCFAAPLPPDPAIQVGETGVAGFAGVVAAARHPHVRDLLGMAGDSRVLVVLTEGVTDPWLYGRFLASGLGGGRARDANAPPVAVFG